MGGKQKLAKDPNAPKRAKSSFIYFSCEMRPRIVAENPSLKTTEIMQILGERWGNLNDGQKQRFKDMQEEDKLRYEREKANYVPPADLPKLKGKKKKNHKDPNEPKKAKTGFIFFSMKFRQQVRDSQENMSIPETGRRLGAMWKELTEAQKEPYQKMHEDDKVRYQREMDVYKANKAAGQQQSAMPHYEEEEDDEEESDSE